MGRLDSGGGIAVAAGRIFSLLLTRTHFSVSSGLGFLALIGVSVEIGVIMVEYINQLRTRGAESGARSGQGRRISPLRPIMMTMLVATLGAAAGRHVARHRI
jgi:heavy metal efflux system protein